MDRKCVFTLSLLGLFQCYNSKVLSESKFLESRNTQKKLVIDQDGGADDAMAVAMCILYERYFNGPIVVAITTTAGNVPENQVFNNTQRFLDITNRRNVPIYRGATRSLVVSVESDFYFGHDGLGDSGNLSHVEAIKAQEAHAAIALIELSKLYEGELIVMAIGPLTNIALAQRLDPMFIGRLSQLYVGAGHIHNHLSQEPEFNALLDAEAYHIVTESSTPDKVTLVPFSQIMKSLNLTRDWRLNVLGAIDTELTRTLIKYERLSLPTHDTWTLLDPAVAAIVLDHNLVSEYKYFDNSIILCGDKRGFNTNIEEDPNVRLVYSANEEYYKELLIKIFSAELNKPTELNPCLYRR